MHIHLIIGKELGNTYSQIHCRSVVMSMLLLARPPPTVICVANKIGDARVEKKLRRQTVLSGPKPLRKTQDHKHTKQNNNSMYKIVYSLPCRHELTPRMLW